MKKLINHFKFRLSQSFRLLNLNPRASIPALLIFIILIVMKLPESYYYPPLFFILTLLFHYERKDIPFLKKVFAGSWRWVVGLEAACIYSVLLLGNIHYQFEKTGGVCFLLIALSGFLTPGAVTLPAWKWNFIPEDLFEWKSFLRKNSWMAVLGWMVVLLSCYHPASLLLAGVFALDYVSHIYEPNENKEMLAMYFRKYTLKEKIRRNSLFFNGLLLPAYCLFMILNPAESLYVLYYFAFMNLYFLLILTRKYKKYHYKEKNNYYNMGVYFEYFICSITIIPAILLLKNNIKDAGQNIRTYAGD
ncbi:hypothetical protein [Chryseobacterium arthrosphaerae]|uniref:hypothetical protein n=1 Tax=Chryseobacterium arthrosphaerae TaxID=651561 RepID=UPI0031E2A5EA